MCNLIQCMLPWTYQYPQFKRYLDRSSRFCRARDCDRQTDRPTDHATPSVTIDRIYVHNTAMRSNNTTTTTTVLRPFFRDHPGEPVPEENFWTLWCKGRLTEADKLTIRLGATPSGLTSSHLHHPPIFFTGQMPFLPPNQQCQRTEGN